MKKFLSVVVFTFVFLGVCAEDAFARRIKVVIARPRPAVAVFVGS